MRSFVYLSDTALHLFIQSELSISEINDKLHEEIKPNCPKRIHTNISSGRIAQFNTRVKPECNRSCSSHISSGSAISESESESER